MLGTLIGVLEAREVKLGPDAVRADVEGINEIQDRLPVLTRIHVHYVLRVPADAREAVDRALDRHQSKCPTARTLGGAVEVVWTADIAEV